MRVLILSGHYPPPFSANGVRAMYIAKALREEGHDVAIIPLNITFNKKGFFGETIITITNKSMDSDSNKGFYKRPSIIKRIFDIINKHVKVNELVSIAKDFNPDIVIGTLPPVEAPLLAHAITQKTQAKLVIDVQDLADDYRILERPWLTPAIKLYFRQVYIAVRNADLVSVTTEYIRDAIVSRIRHNRIIIVPNGVDNNFFMNCYKVRESTSLLNLAVFLGDLNFKYHKLDAFIYALKLAKNNGIYLKLRVIGEGTLLPRLKRLVEKLDMEKDVEFLGYIEREKLPETLGQAIFGVAGRPSVNNSWIINTMRLTILEYLSCGLPILAYGPSNSYTQYFVTRHNVGIYIPTNNSKQIASGITKLVKIIRNNPDITYKCRKIALKYDWNIVTRKLAKRITELH